MDVELFNELKNNEGMIKDIINTESPITRIYSNLLLMFVSGPNKSRLYHTNPSDEVLYQIKGDVKILVIEKGRVNMHVLCEGSSLVIPAGTPHYPLREAGTLGLVVEQLRSEGDVYSIHCSKCAVMIQESSNSMDLEQLFQSETLGSIKCGDCR